MIGLVGVSALAFMEIRVITRALLTSEVIGAILVTILSLVILVKVIFSHGPQGQTFTSTSWSLPHGSGISTIAKAAVYGFLAFAGFEGAAALGEETSSPKTQIPRAIKTAVVVVGAFYLVTAAAQSLGYGATAAGAAAYGAGLPFSDLGAGYIGKWYADILEPDGHRQPVRHLARRGQRRARIMYAQARDATGKKTGLAGLSKHGQPRRALIVVLLHHRRPNLIDRAARPRDRPQRHVLGAAGRHRAHPDRLRDGRRRRDPLPVLQRRAEGADVAAGDPLLGGAFVCYTIYRNVFIGQTGAPGAARLNIEIAYLIIGLVVVLVAPGLAGRVRAGWRPERCRRPDRVSAAGARAGRSGGQPKR